jgi:hypothetical protein
MFTRNTLYVFYPRFNEHNNQASKHKKKRKFKIQHKIIIIIIIILQIHNIKNIDCLNITHSLVDVDGIVLHVLNILTMIYIYCFIVGSVNVGGSMSSHECSSIEGRK